MAVAGGESQREHQNDRYRWSSCHPRHSHGSHLLVTTTVAGGSRSSHRRIAGISQVLSGGTRPSALRRRTDNLVDESSMATFLLAHANCRHRWRRSLSLKIPPEKSRSPHGRQWEALAS